MALDPATFKTRTATAIIFAIVMLAGLLLNRWSFIILFIIIHFGCWYEYIKLMKRIKSAHPFFYFPVGLMYITMPVFMLICLRTGETNIQSMPDNFLKVIPCGIIFSIWINDTMAYIVGSFIGKTPLSKVSPKKTWEGTLGGVVLALVVSFFYSLLKAEGVKIVIITAIAVVAGTFGDLLESKLKRVANVKDSGTLLPGHGGFLDRFDSLLLATPFVWLY